ncbi:hypothetical protein EVAR_32974_1 [Eumeta japonica]|uniref:Uncharacterized protein n=1 Tax=Eumeta variegata TaxID=151549 RepID=A0A4C1WYI2_EUMVA|nr:hypothetical protein EVAR_32974_1 [Eumeta japonica]
MRQTNFAQGKPDCWRGDACRGDGSRRYTIDIYCPQVVVCRIWRRVVMRKRLCYSLPTLFDGAVYYDLTVPVMHRIDVIIAEDRVVRFLDEGSHWSLGCRVCNRACQTRSSHQKTRSHYGNDAYPRPRARSPNNGHRMRELAPPQISRLRHRRRCGELTTGLLLPRFLRPALGGHPPTSFLPFIPALPWENSNAPVFAHEHSSFDAHPSLFHRPDCRIVAPHMERGTWAFRLHEGARAARGTPRPESVRHTVHYHTMSPRAAAPPAAPSAAAPAKVADAL